MNTPNTQLASPPPTQRPAAAFGQRGIEIRQYDELVRFSQTIADSGLAPKGMDKPQALFVAIQMGLELGLSPMAAVQNVAVVNGRPTLWGDAQLAVCRGTGELELFEEWYEQGGQKSARNPTEYKDDTAAVCRVKRAGGQPIESAFSVADAKRAGLWGKQGPWTQYPFRMLRNRARSFALRDGFGDALRGFRSTEEAMDSPDERVVTGREVPAAVVPAAVVPALLSGPSSTAPAPLSDPAPEPQAENQENGRARKTTSRQAAASDAAETTSAKPAGGAPVRSPVPETSPAGDFSLSDEPPPQQAKDIFWRKVKDEGLDEVEVLTALKRNGLSDADYPADLTNMDAEDILSKHWSALVKSVRNGGGK